MTRHSPLFSLTCGLAALPIFLAAAAPVHAVEPELTAALEVQAVQTVDTSRQVDGLTAATPVVLADGSRLEAGSPIAAGDRIVSGTVQNAFGESLVVSLSDGCLMLLAPGELVTIAEGRLVASTHECVCKCTCSGDGFSEGFTVDAACDGSADCSALNGSDCLVFVGTELKEGTASGCTFKIVPKHSTTSATTAVQ
jgi:hypothetical protein